ncbi:hypothetical protein AYI69_g5970 [Smittium culicis]|uniref:Uncharacterized protein n=1 Tax=Smittium culicis TaxID=133412 RepID=A0A1R1Y2W4_9FUNG|nr:hypothetical protein AYI69_g5970 [Smittium culicis]
MCTSRLVMCDDAFAGVAVPSGNDDIKCAYLLLCWICGWLIAPALEPVTYGWLNDIVDRPLNIELLVFDGFENRFCKKSNHFKPINPERSRRLTIKLAKCSNKKFNDRFQLPINRIERQFQLRRNIRCRELLQVRVLQPVHRHCRKVPVILNHRRARKQHQIDYILVADVPVHIGRRKEDYPQVHARLLDPAIVCRHEMAQICCSHVPLATVIIRTLKLDPLVLPNPIELAEHLPHHILITVRALN